MQRHGFFLPQHVVHSSQNPETNMSRHDLAMPQHVKAVQKGKIEGMSRHDDVYEFFFLLTRFKRTPIVILLCSYKKEVVGTFERHLAL